MLLLKHMSLVIVSIPIFVIAVVASTAIGGAHWPNWFFVVGEVVFGSGSIVLGYGLWLHRTAPARTASTRKVRICLPTGLPRPPHQEEVLTEGHRRR